MNINRQAAGSKKAGQSVGGQFAPTEKSEASGAGLIVENEKRTLQHIIDERQKQLDRLSDLRRIMEEEEAVVQRDLLSGRVRLMIGDEHPEATQVIFHHSDDAQGMLRFNGLQQSNGEPVEITDDQQEELSDFVDGIGFYSHSALTDDPATVEGYDPDYPVMTLVEPSMPDSSEKHRLIDTSEITHKEFEALDRLTYRSLGNVSRVRTAGGFADAVEEYGYADEGEFTDEQLSEIGRLAAQEYDDNETFARLETAAFKDAMEEAVESYRNGARPSDRFQPAGSQA